MNFKSYADLSSDIFSNIHKVQANNYHLVVGLPRSGMIPAYMISLLLNIDCTDLNSFVRNEKLTKGRTRKTKRLLGHAWDAQKVLLVDDTVCSGSSMDIAVRSIPRECPCEVTRLAVYAEKSGLQSVDVYLEIVSLPRVFQWNIFHHAVVNNACVDIDGVLCVDPTHRENDDGEKYINFLKSAKPLILPTYRIHSLVTNRLEKYRAHTVRWLEEQNIQYDNLVMLDLPTMEERQRSGIHSKHKAEYYKSSRTQMFIESDERQATEIARLSGKPVYCFEANRMCYPDEMAVIKYGKKPFLKAHYRRIKRRVSGVVPKPFKSFVKQFAGENGKEFIK